MGMFDRDKMMAPDGPLKNWAGEGGVFILWDIEHKGTIPTDLDPETDITHLVVSVLDAPDNKAIVSMLGEGPKQRAAEKADGDLPAVCRALTVPTKDDGKSDAYVFNFIEPYDGQKKVKATA